MNKEHKEVNYLSLFFLGLILLSTGLIFAAVINPVCIGIMASGLSLMAVALAKRDKWSTTN